MRFYFLLIGLLILGSACSTMDIDNQRRSELDAYIQGHLKQQKMFLKLKETAAAQVLEVTPELTAKQGLVAPGFEAQPKDNQALWIVSLEMPDWLRFNIEDLKFYWGEEKSKSVKEIMDPHLIQTLYPFAYPHDRLFIVEFKKSEKPLETLKIQTSQGQFSFRTLASESGENP